MGGKNGRLKASGIDVAAPNVGRPLKPRKCSLPRRNPADTCPAQAGEGQRPAADCEFFCCERPGCEERFARSSRSPCQKFCSPSCRQALRRVIERERRWRQRARPLRRQRAGRPVPRALSSLTRYCPRPHHSLRFIRPQKEEGAGGSRSRSGPPASFLRFSHPGDRAMNPYPVGQVCPVRAGRVGRSVSPLSAASAPGRARRWRSRCAAGASARRSWPRCGEEKPQVLDGFTRWEAALQVRGMTTLSVRLIDVDDRRAKAAIHGLNQTGRRPHELEEAWIVQALVREDGLSQTEVAELLGRHKSWVCRRLALLEKLCTGRASGPGSRAVDSDRGAGDRPVAGRQPIGSGRCDRGGRRSTARS